MKYVVTLGSILSIFYINSVRAEVKVADLYYACSHAKTEQLMHAACVEYIAGIVDGMVSQMVLTKSRPVYCAPDKLTAEDAGDIFIKGIDSDERLKEAPNAGIALVLILQRKFACGLKM